MISNIMPCCCRQHCCSNKNFYLQVKNECPVYLSIILYYTIHDKRITKPSLVFGPGKTEHVTFPSDAKDLDFDVNNCSFKPPTLILNKSIIEHVSSCFKVIKNHTGHFQCVSIPC